MKAQVMLEFIMIVGIAMFIGIIYLVGVYGLLGETAQQQRIAELNNIGYTIQDELILATTASDGYQRTFVVPQKAGRFVYNMTSTNYSVTLTSSDTTMIYDVPECAMNASMNISKGNNTIRKQGAVSVNLN